MLSLIHIYINISSNKITSANNLDYIIAIDVYKRQAPYVGFPRVLNAIFVAKEIFTDRK